MSPIREFKALRSSEAQLCAPFDLTLIRVVTIDPYNRKIRQTRMARGLFALDAVDGITNVGDKRVVVRAVSGLVYAGN